MKRSNYIVVQAVLWIAIFIVFGIFFHRYTTTQDLPEPLHSFDETSVNTFSKHDYHIVLEEALWDQHCVDHPTLPDAQQWSDVERMNATGLPLVLIPSVCLVAPISETGVSGGFLELPSPPYATRYEDSAAFGADTGSTVVASHVNYRNQGENAPFARLHYLQKGAPIMIREADGTEHVYAAEINEVYQQTDLPPEVFDTDGEHVLNLVTCTVREIAFDGSESTVYDNLVVTAVSKS